MFLLPEQNDETSRIKRLKLGPLDLEALEQLIYDTLRRDRVGNRTACSLVKGEDRRKSFLCHSVSQVATSTAPGAI